MAIVSVLAGGNEGLSFWEVMGIWSAVGGSVMLLCCLGIVCIVVCMTLCDPDSNHKDSGSTPKEEEKVVYTNCGTTTPLYP